MLPLRSAGQVCVAGWLDTMRMFAYSPFRFSIEVLRDSPHVELIVMWFFATIPLGPNAVAVIDASIRNGWRRAAFFSVGIGLAALLYALVTYLGVASLVAERPKLLAVLAVCGSLYVLYLGTTIARRAPVVLDDRVGRDGAGTLLVRGVKVSLANPKAALMFVAVLPRFFTAAEGVIDVLVVFATVFCMAVFVYTAYAIGAATFRAYILSSPQRQAVLNYFSALSFVAISVFIWSSAYQLWVGR